MKRERNYENDVNYENQLKVHKHETASYFKSKDYQQKLMIEAFKPVKKAWETFVYSYIKKMFNNILKPLSGAELDNMKNKFDKILFQVKEYNNTFPNATSELENSSRDGAKAVYLSLSQIKYFDFKGAFPFKLYQCRTILGAQNKFYEETAGCLQKVKRLKKSIEDILDSSKRDPSIENLKIVKTSLENYRTPIFKLSRELISKYTTLTYIQGFSHSQSSKNIIAHFIHNHATSRASYLKENLNPYLEWFNRLQKVKDDLTHAINNEKPELESTFSLIR